MFGLNAGGDYFKNKLFLKRKFDDDVDEYLENEKRSSKRSYILETEVDTVLQVTLLLQKLRNC